MLHHFRRSPAEAESGLSRCWSRSTSTCAPRINIEIGDY